MLFAAGLDDLESIPTVVSTLEKTVNVLMSTTDLPFGFLELSDRGVKRIGAASAFAQVTYGSSINAAREIAAKGSLEFTSEALDYRELEAFFA